MMRIKFIFLFMCLSMRFVRARKRIAVLLLCVGFWVVPKVVSQIRQYAVAQFLEDRGCYVIRSGGGDEEDYDFIDAIRGRSVDEVEINYRELTEDELGYLTAFKDVRLLNLTSATVTDAGLKRLTCLKRVQYLNLRNTSVTDEGLSDWRSQVIAL